MRIKLIPAALIAAMLATPAVACTDWKAVAAFDATLYAQAQDDKAVIDRCRESWGAWWKRNITAGIDDCEPTSDWAHRIEHRYYALTDREHPPSPTSARRTPDDFSPGSAPSSAS